MYYLPLSLSIPLSLYIQTPEASLPTRLPACSKVKRGGGYC